MALKSQGRSRRLDNTVLVGREPELGIVDDLFEHVSERGSVLMVRGEPGIGKSALLAEVRLAYGTSCTRTRGGRNVTRPVAMS